MKLRSTLPIAVLLAALVAPCGADEPGRGELPDAVDARGDRLVLTASGTGVRAMVLRVYVVGLYQRQRTSSPSRMLGDDGPRRLAVKMLRDVDRSSMRQGIEDALEDKAGLGPYRAHAAALFEALPVDRDGLRRGDILTLDWRPGEGIVACVNQTRCLGPVPSAGLFDALVRMWLNEDPRRSILKPA